MADRSLYTPCAHAISNSGREARASQQGHARGRAQFARARDLLPVCIAQCQAGKGQERALDAGDSCRNPKNERGCDRDLIQAEGLLERFVANRNDAPQALLPQAKVKHLRLHVVEICRFQQSVNRRVYRHRQDEWE